jgi:RNA polymerase sigma-70 factor, ECF subfamily
VERRYEMLSFINKNKIISKKEFMEFVHIRMDILFRIALTYVKNKELANDIVQDAILNAYKNLDSLKEKEKFNSWITTILVNRCREILRKDKKISLFELKEEILSENKITNDYYDNDYTKVDNKIDVLSILQNIDEKYRDVISLKYLGDYTIEEISNILNIPQGTVKSRLNFGINKLKKLMEVKENVL